MDATNKEWIDFTFSENSFENKNRVLHCISELKPLALTEAGICLARNAIKQCTKEI